MGVESVRSGEPAFFIGFGHQRAFAVDVVSRAACCVLRDSLGNSSFGLLFTNRSGNIIYFCHAFRHLPHFL